MADTGGKDVTKTRLIGWQVKWGTSGSQHDFGGFDDVTVDLPVKKKAITIPSLGDVVLGRRIIGLEEGAKVEIVCRQIDLTLFQKSMPWYSGGAIGLTPATDNKDEYDYANLLTLHPMDQGTADEDINLIKTVPVIQAPKHQGNNDSTCKIVFNIYPDRAQLPLKVYGYVGAVPS